LGQLKSQVAIILATNLNFRRPACHYRLG